MKRIISFFILAFLCGKLMAQAPMAINYQAVARDNSGALMANKTVSLRISILSGSASGTTEYSETFSSVNTNAYGLFTIQIGNGSAVNGTFSGIKWSSNTHYIKVEMDGSGGSSYSFMGSSQILSVPYALYAQKSGDSTRGNNQSITYDSAARNLTITDAGGTKTTHINIKADDLSDNSINSLKDVKASSATNGQVLKFNGKNWIAGNDSIGGGSGSGAWVVSGSDMYNSNSGKVGIGVTSPIYKLHVSDSLFYSSAGIARTAYFRAFGDTGNNTYLALQGSAFANINSGSNVGVQGYGGLATAGKNVNIGFNEGFFGQGNGSAYVNRGMEGYTDGTGLFNQAIFGRADGSVSSGTTNCGALGYATNADDNRGLEGLTDGAGTANYGTFSGAVGTGTTNYGLYSTASSGKTNYAGYFAGDIAYTGSLSSVSDARFKTNIMAVNGVLPLLRQLEVKKYNYKRDEYKAMNLPTGMQYGFLAQDLEKVFPILVTNNVFHNPKFSNIFSSKGGKPGLLNSSTNSSESFEYKGINYIGLIPILTEAIKEQQNLIDAQNAKIDELAKRIEALEKSK